MPGYDPRVHGVSYSMMADFMECRQKARFRYSGVKTKAPAFALTFGTIAHEVLDLAHKGISSGKITKIPGQKRVDHWVKLAEETWRKQNSRASPRALEFLELSCLYAEAVMPGYFKFWAKDLFRWKWDERLTETFYKFPFKISHDVTIPILVKMDSAYWLTKKLRRSGKKVKRLYLFETKTSSRISETAIVDVAPMSLQQNIYLMALEHITGTKPRGTTRNVIRRPGQRRKKTESLVDFKARIMEDVVKRPEHYYMRFLLSADPQELQTTRGDLQGILSEFIQWYDGHRIHYRSTNACETKYGLCQYFPICARDDWSGFTGRIKK